MKLDQEDLRKLEMASLFGVMIKGQAWQALRAMLQANLDTWVKQLTLPDHLRSKDTMVPSTEFLRGSIHGMSLAFALPTTIMTEAAAIQAEVDNDTEVDETPLDKPLENEQ